jgi:hypothetical protein
VVLRARGRRLISAHAVTLIATAVLLACTRSDSPQDWRVTDRGIGPVRVGMTVAQAEASLGMTLQRRSLPADCAYVWPDGRLSGVSFMVIRDSIARIDVDSGEVATEAGARVGDSQERVLQLYGNRLAVSPHKYVTGNYLTHTPSDTSYRILFETDGQHVTRYRAGRMPEVEWVERCG